MNLPLLAPSGPRKIVHSSIVPNGVNNCLTSSSVCCLLSIPTNSLRSFGNTRFFGGFWIWRVGSVTRRSFFLVQNRDHGQLSGFYHQKVGTRWLRFFYVCDLMQPGKRCTTMERKKQRKENKLVLNYLKK